MTVSTAISDIGAAEHGVISAASLFGILVGAVALGHLPDQLTGDRAGGRLVLARLRGLPAPVHE